MGEKVRTNELGHIEIVDEETGEIIATEGKRVPKDGKPAKRSGPGKGRRRKADEATHHYVLDQAGRKLWVPKGTNPDQLPMLVWPYSKVTCDHICMKITEGHTIRDIGMMEGFPPATVIHHWARKHEEFKKDLKEARAARAEYYHDKVFEIAEKKGTGKGEVMRDKLSAELYKWGAQVGDPGTFGNKTVHAGDPDNPIGFIVATGVPQLEKKDDAIPTTATPVEGDE